MPAPTPKYELLRDQVRSIGLDQRVFRIRALRDIPEHKVRAGDLGGFVEGWRNLSEHGAAWIADDAMAVGDSRVEDDALLRGGGHLSGRAILQEEAVLEALGRATDRSVVGGRARVAGATIRDDALVTGQVVIRHPLILGGEVAVRHQEDVPWSLHHADPREPDYEARLREAVALDPAFHHAFALLGARDAVARRAAVDELLGGPEAGRRALHAIARSLGGTFHPDRYEPRSPAQLAADASLDIHMQASMTGITNFRHLRMVDEEGAVEAPTGGRLLSGVVMAETRDPASDEPSSFYQPALVHEIPPDRPTLSLVPGQVYISPEVHGDFVSAFVRARELLRLAGSLADGSVTEMPRRSADDARPDGALDHLPFVARAQAIEEDDWRAPPVARIAVQALTLKESPTAFGRQMGLQEPQGHLVIEVGKRDGARLDLANLVLRSGLRFRPSVEAAHRAVEPIYSGQADLMARLAHDSARADDSPRRARAGEALLHELIDAEAPPARDAAPQAITAGAIRGALRPLGWRNAPNLSGEWRRVGQHHEDAFEAESLNRLFTVEDQGDGTWSLYVEHSNLSARDRKPAGGYGKPLHREDGLPSEAAAMEAAEAHRADLIAAELEAPNPAMRLGHDARTTARDDDAVELAAVFRVSDADGNETFRPGRASLRHGRVAFTVDADAHPSPEAAAELATRRIEQRPATPNTTIHMRQPLALAPGA